MKIIDDGQNLRTLRKLAEVIIRDDLVKRGLVLTGPEAADLMETFSGEIFDCVKRAYILGKAEGRLEITVENGKLGATTNG